MANLFLLRHSVTIFLSQPIHVVFSSFCRKNAENDYFDQLLGSAAPKRWSKYSTYTIQRPTNLTNDLPILKLLIINRSLVNRWCNQTGNIAGIAYIYKISPCRDMNWRPTVWQAPDNEIPMRQVTRLAFDYFSTMITFKTTEISLNR